MKTLLAITLLLSLALLGACATTASPEIPPPAQLDPY